mgnify:CR=1 FL=1
MSSEGEIYYINKNLDLTLDGALLLNAEGSNTNVAQPGLIRYNSDTDKFEGYVASGRDFVNGSNFVPMSLDVATSSSLGGIKLGNNLSITADGKMNAVASAVSRKFQKILIVSQSVQENTDPEATNDYITTGDYRSINQCIIQFFGYDANTDTFPNGELGSLNKDEYPDPSENNKYVVLLTPGEYKEDLTTLTDIDPHQTIDIPPFVTVMGDDRDSCVINIKNLTSIIMRRNTALKNLTIDLTNANENITPTDPNEIIKAIDILSSANNITIENVVFKISTCNINTSFIYSNTNNNVLIRNINLKTDNLPASINTVDNFVSLTVINGITSQIIMDNCDLYVESNKHNKYVVYAENLSAITIYNCKLEIKETNLSDDIEITNSIIHLTDSILTCNYTSIKCTGYDNEFINNNNPNPISNRGITVGSSQNYNSIQSSQTVFIHQENNSTNDTIKVPISTIDFSNYYVNGSKLKLSGTTNNNSIVTASYTNTGVINEFGGSIPASILGCDIGSTLVDEEINNTSIVNFKELFQVNIFTSQITADSEVIYFQVNDGMEAFTDNYYIQCSQTQLNGVNPSVSDSVIIFNHNNELIVGKEDANFSNITDALNSISDASSTNKYTVIVKPGTYIESQQLVIPEYVSLLGDNVVVKFDKNASLSTFPDNVNVILNSNINISNIEFIFDKVQIVGLPNIGIATNNYLSTFEDNIGDETYFNALDTITGVTLHNVSITVTDTFINLDKLRPIVFIKMIDSIITNSRIKITHSHTSNNELDAVIVYNKLCEINYNSFQVDITGTTTATAYTVFKNDSSNSNYNNPDILVNIQPSENSTIRLMETNNTFETNINNPNLSVYNTLCLGGTMRAFRNTNFTLVESLYADYNSTLIAANMIIEGDARDRNNPQDDYPNSLLKTMNCVGVSRDGNLVSDVTELSPDGGQTVTSNSLHVGHQVGVPDNIPFYNVLVGVRVATLNTVGTRNTMMGVNVGTKQVSGTDNVYFGYNTARNALESKNVFIGSNVASELVSGSKNVFIGKDTGSNTDVVNKSIIVGHNTGNHIHNLEEGIIIGDSSMNMSDTATMSNIITIGSNGVGDSLVSSSKDIIMGSYTASSLETTTDSILMGHNTGTSMTESSKSIVVGNNTGTSITTAENTIVIGNENMVSTTSTTQTKNNLVVGNRAMKNATTAKDNIVMGNGAGRNITTGSRNVILGQEQYTAGNTTSPAKSLTTGSDSVIIGSNVATSVTSGSRNFVMGNNSGNSLDLTSDTIILGYNSGSNISGGSSQDSQNIIIGNETGKLASSGKVIMIGHEAGQKSSGVDSLIIGNRAGRTIAGPRNTIIGNKAAGISNDENNPVQGQDNVLIGTYSGYELTTGSYNIILGSGDGSNTAVLGTLDTAGAGYALKSGDKNFIAGFNAGRKLQSGSENILLGSQAGAYLNQSNRNVLIGNNAGMKLGSNDSQEANSENNVIIGNDAGENITLGNELLFIGRAAGQYSTQGQQNTYIGNYTGQVNNGSKNTFIGNRAGFYNKGDNNTIIGTDAGRYSETSSFNTLIGFEAGRGTSELQKNVGNFNTAIGYQSGQELTTGYRNLYLGYQAGQRNKEGAKNIMIGPNAGLNSRGSKSIFIGAAESNTGGIGFNTTGELNLVIGTDSGVAMTSGERNVFLGSYAGQNTTTASSSVLIGADSGQNITTGSDNVLVGPGTGQNIVTGENNIMIGDRAGNEATNGASENILIGTLAGSKTEINESINIGNKAGQNNQTGIGNILIGRYAGQKFEQSCNNIMIGSNAGASFYPTGSNITLGENIYIGPEVGRNNVSGLKNIVIGSDAFSSSTQGSGVIAIGYQAGKKAGILNQNNNGLYENTIIGFEAGSQGDLGRNNVIIGSQSGRNIDNGRKFEGNVLLGSDAGKNSNLSVNTVVLGYANKYGSGGVNNVIAGTNAGDNLGFNEYKSFESLYDLGSTFLNVLVVNINLSVLSKVIRNGDKILIDDGITTFETIVSSISFFSVFIDNLKANGINLNIDSNSTNISVLFLKDTYLSSTVINAGAKIIPLSTISNIVGDNDTSKSSANSMLGFNAGKSITTGSKNVIFGSEALQTNSVGKYNNIIGTQAGYNAITDNNTFLGTKSGYSVDSQEKEIISCYTYSIENNIIDILFNTSNSLGFKYSGNTVNFNYGDLIDLDNTSFNNGRYKIESFEFTDSTATTGNTNYLSSYIKVQGYPQISQLGNPDTVSVNDLKLNSSLYILENFEQEILPNSQFIRFDDETSTKTIHSNRLQLALINWDLDDINYVSNDLVYHNGNVVGEGVGDRSSLMINNYPVIKIEGSRYNDGLYYSRPNNDDYRILDSYSNFYSENLSNSFIQQFNSKISIKSVFTQNIIESGISTLNLLNSSAFYVLLPTINGFYRVSKDITKYISTIPINNCAYIDDNIKLSETDNAIIFNYFANKSKINTVFTEGINNDISFNGSYSSNDYIELNTIYIYDRLNIQKNIDISLGEGILSIASTSFTFTEDIFRLGGSYKIIGTENNNNLIINISYIKNYREYYFNVISGVLVSETDIIIDINNPIIFKNVSLSKLTTDITDKYGKGDIINVNYNHKNGMEVNTGSYIIENTYNTVTDGYKLLLLENQNLKSVNDSINIPINDTNATNYVSTEQKNIDLNINKEIYKVDEDYMNNTNIHISGQDLIFQTGNIDIYGSNIFSLHSSNNTITSTSKYHFTDIVSPCMIRLDNNYYLVEHNKYPFNKLEISSTTPINTNTTSSSNIELHSVSSRLGLVDLGKLQQETQYRIFGGNNQHLNLITPVSNSNAISNISVFCTSSSQITNYKSNNKQLLLESNHNSITENTPIATGYHDGYFKYLNQDISNVDIRYDDVHTLYEPLYSVSTLNTNILENNKFIILRDFSSNEKYNIVNTVTSSSFEDLSSGIIDTYNANSSSYYEISTLTSNFTLYGNSFNTFKINSLGYLLFETSTQKHNVSFFLNELTLQYENLLADAIIKTKYLSSDGLSDNIYLIEYASDTNNITGTNNCQIKLYLDNCINANKGRIEINYSENINTTSSIRIGLNSTQNTVKESMTNYNIVTDGQILITPQYIINNENISNFSNNSVRIQSFNRTDNLSKLNYTGKLTNDTTEIDETYGDYISVYNNKLLASSNNSNVGFTLYEYDNNNGVYNIIQKVIPIEKFDNYNRKPDHIIFNENFIIFSDPDAQLPNLGKIEIHKYNDFSNEYEFFQKITNEAHRNLLGHQIQIYRNLLLAYQQQKTDDDPLEYATKSCINIYKYEEDTDTSTEDNFILFDKLTDHTNELENSTEFGLNGFLINNNGYLAVQVNHIQVDTETKVIIYKYNDTTETFDEIQKISDTYIVSDRYMSKVKAIDNNYLILEDSKEGDIHVYKFNTSIEKFIYDHTLEAITYGNQIHTRHIKINNDIIVRSVVETIPTANDVEGVYVYNYDNNSEQFKYFTKITEYDSSYPPGVNLEFGQNIGLSDNILAINSPGVSGVDSNAIITYNIQSSVNFITYNGDNEFTSNYSNYTELTSNNITLTNLELGQQLNIFDNYFSNITISKYGYVQFEDEYYQYILNVFNINQEFDTVKYKVDNDILSIYYDLDNTGNLYIQSNIHLENNSNSGDIILSISPFTSNNVSNAVVGIDALHLNTYNNSNIDISSNNSILVYMNDTSNVSGYYDYIAESLDTSSLQYNDIVKISNANINGNNGYFSITDVNKNHKNDNIYYFNIKNDIFETEEYNSNINILINEWVGSNISFSNIRLMTGEHSDFLRFNKLRQNIFEEDLDLVQKNNNNLNILDKSLNFSVNTNIFNNSNIIVDNVVVLNEQVPMDLIEDKILYPYNTYEQGQGRTSVLKNINNYSITLGTPFLPSLSTDSNIVLQKEVENINKETIGFLDVYQEHNSNVFTILNPNQYTFDIYGSLYLDNSNSCITISNLEIASLPYRKLDNINGNIKDILQPFKKCQPGNIINIKYTGDSASLDDNYLISNISSDGKQIYIDNNFNTLPTGNTEINISTELNYINIGYKSSLITNKLSGQIITDRYNFANFSNIDIDNNFNFGSDIDLATGTYLAVINNPILNYEKLITNDTGNSSYKSIYYNNCIIPSNSIRFYTNNINEYNNSNVLSTLDFSYSVNELVNDNIMIDTCEHNLIIPTSNLTLTLIMTDLEYVNHNTTAELSNLSINFNDNVIISNDTNTDFTKFNKDTILGCPFFTNSTIMSNVYLHLSDTVNNTASNLYISDECSLSLSKLFEIQFSHTTNTVSSQELITYYPSLSNVLFNQVGIYSKNPVNTNVSEYYNKDTILVSPTINNPIYHDNIRLKYNSYLIDDSSNSFIYFNEYYLQTNNITIVSEKPDFLKIEKVIINHENSITRYPSNSDIITYQDNSNTVITLDTSDITVNKSLYNFNEFTYDQDCALIINSNIVSYCSINNNITPTDNIINVSYINEDYYNSNVVIYKKLSLTKIGNSLNLTTINNTGLYHYQDAQGNNLMLGSFSGQYSGSKTQSIHNTYIGSKVGQTNHGSGNLFFGSETGLATNSSQGETYFNNKFAIYKNEFIGVSNNPLIGGDFTSGTFGVNTINPDSLVSSPLDTKLRMIVNGSMRAHNVSTFTGTHIITFTDNTKLSSIEPGMIISSTGNVNKLHLIDTIVECELTTKEKDKAVFGIFTKSENNSYNYFDKYQNKIVNKNNKVYYAAGVGEGQIWVSNIAGNIELGDYVCSSNIAGYAMKQDDDLVHNYTIAKVTEKVNWDTINKIKIISNKNVKVALLACVYLCS